MNKKFLTRLGAPLCFGLLILISSPVVVAQQQDDTLSSPEVMPDPFAPLTTEIVTDLESEPTLFLSAEAKQPDFEDDIILAETFAQRLDQDGHIVDQTLLTTGDRVEIGVQVRNEGKRTVRRMIVTQPLPGSLVYIEDPPSVQKNRKRMTLLYSVDQGRFFSTLDQLTIEREDGVEYPASPADVSHIRWVLEYPLKPRQTALLSFRAVVR